MQSRKQQKSQLRMTTRKKTTNSREKLWKIRSDNR
jgi:hypothetical protein